MDQSWRPPPIPGNICPICSISHFPFCPPPPFIQNPRFHYSQPQHDYYHRPPPSHHHRHPSPNHQNSSLNSNYYYANPRPTLNMTPYDNGGGIKRMKIESISDNERILKLIHDHGSAAVNSTPPESSNCLKLRGQVYEISNQRYMYGKNGSQPAADAMQPNRNLLSADSHYAPTSFGTPLEVQHGYGGQPPLPASPPPSLPIDVPRNHFFEPHATPKKPSLFPVSVGSSADSSSCSAVLENQASAPVYHTNASRSASSLPSVEEFHIRQSSTEKHARDVQPFSFRHLSSEKQNIIDASHIFKQPHRASRPDHFVIILRGLPGSGKSYLAKVLRDIEVENGGEAPRIHSMDEYFMIEVEKRSGYEVYLVEASYKDPVGCAARNVHSFTLPDIQKMAEQWEEAPPLYLKMDIKSLLHGDSFDESGIQEVDMDMEDEDASPGSNVKWPHYKTKDQVDDFRPHDELKDVTVTNDVHQTEEVKDLCRSKWSNDFDVEEGGNKKNSSGALSGLVQAYSSKETKSVSWGDQGGNVGFSISATRKTKTRSLVIGPGPGYNLKSNPLSEEEHLEPSRNAVEPKTQNVFQERIRAERESFKAVFDKRRQRIGGFNVDDE